MKFILVGQPNCGKSTIFNFVAGYKSVATNFPGVTVKYTKGEMEIHNRKIDLIDLPGTYSLQTTDDAESVAVKALMNSEDSTIIINIIDASVLSRSLELTLQLLEMKKTMVVALNMVDEAEKKGININIDGLSDLLGVPVVKTIGNKGVGVFSLFDKAYEIGSQPFKYSITDKGVNKVEQNSSHKIKYGAILEKAIEQISALIKEGNVKLRWNHRFVAIKILEKDANIKNYLKELEKSLSKQIDDTIDKLEETMGEKSNVVISSARHSSAFDLFEEIAAVGKPPKRDFRSRIDDVLMHPVWGYVSLAVILYLAFRVIFLIGSVFEPMFLDGFSSMSEYFAERFGTDSVLYSIFNGLFTGFGGGLGIVIPYLLPFFILLSFLEDTGYLARVAYLTDNIMHKIGLHGLSIVPILFGYGCTVPAILATRILKSPRDRLVTATLTTLIPCSARMTVIFGLVGFFISMKAAFLVYGINIAVIAILGKILSKSIPEVSPGLVLEIPKYHLPGFKSLAHKTWFRMREFVLVAIPFLIVGSIILEVLNYFNLSEPINNFLSPFTSGMLGLPAVVGITLVFGIMRKELALVLLFTALGTENVIEVMSLGQIMVFTIFVTFYIPCIATFAALAKELDMKKAVIITVLSVVLATVLSLITRGVFTLI